MKVLFVAHYADMYGANRSMLGLIRELKDTCHIQPLVLMPREGKLCDELKQSGIPFKVVKFHLWMSRRYYSGRFYHHIKQYFQQKKQASLRQLENARYVKEIMELTSSFEADLVYSNSSVINIGHLLAQHKNVPHIWHFREFGWEDYKLHKDFYAHEFKKAVSSAAAVIAISKAISKHVLKTVKNAPVHTIYNGVIKKNELTWLDKKVKEIRTERTSTQVFGIVGVIQPEKGQQEAVEAMRLVVKTNPNAQLLVAGDGDTAALKKLVASYGLQNNISFLGFIDNPFEVYAQCDVMLMCSKNEAMGRVTVEAMFASCPVIGYNAAATSELIQHNHTGLLYHNGAQDLAQKMSALLNDHQLTLKLGGNAREYAEKNFLVETYTEKVFQVIKKVVSKNI